MTRVLVGLFTSLAGTLGILALLLVMNGMSHEPPEPPAKKAVVMAAAPQPKAKAKPRPKPKPKPRVQKTSATPPPTLAAGVGGLDLGLFGAAGLDLGSGAESLVGDGALSTMTVDSVDTLPVPTKQVPADYPAAARKRGLSGHVVLLLEVDERGRLVDARVQSASPPGVFDEAALAAVRRWSFQPATYQGRPVGVPDVELRMDFDLERR